MRLNRFVIIYTVLLAGIVTPTYAQEGVRQLPTAGKWSITTELGTSLNLDGDFVDGASQSFTSNPVVGEICTESNHCFLGFSVNTAFSANVNSQDFDDVYDSDIGIAVSFNYGLSDVSEVFGRFRYTSYDADDFTIATATTNGSLFIGGDVMADVPFAAGTEFNADLDDYEEYSITAGYRRFFLGGNGFYPFASIEAGVAFVDDIELELSTAASGSLGKVGFYEDSTVFTGGLGVGFRYEIGKDMALGAETTLRYIDELDDDSDIKGDENDGDSRLDLAVNLGLTWQF